MKIRSKLIVTFLLIALVPLIVSIGVFYFYSKDQVSDEVIDHLASVASIQDARIRSIHQQNMERLRAVASRTQMKILLDKYATDRQPVYFNRMQRFIADAKDSVKEFRSISLYLMNGDIVVSTDEALNNRHQRNSMVFEKGLSANQANLFVYDKNNRVLRLYLSGPLYSMGKQVGVVVIESDINNILAAIHDFTGLGKTGETILATRFNNDQDILLFPTRFSDSPEILSSTQQASTASLIHQALSGQEEIYTDSVDYRQNPVLSVTRFVEGPEWGLVVKIDRQEAFANIQKFFLFAWWTVLFFSFFIVLVAIGWTRRFTYPIVRLSDIANQISHGRLQNKADESTADEIGLLALSFNKMTSSLLTTQQMLKNKLNELESINKRLHEEIKQRQQTEKLLREREEKLAITLNSIGDAVVTTDAEGMVTNLNPIAEKLTGWSQQEAKGLAITDIFPIINATTREKIINPIEIIMKTGETVYLSNDTTLISKNGCEYQIADSAAPIRNDAGDIQGMVLVFNDVTEKYYLKQSIRQQLERFKELSDLGLKLTGVPEDVFDEIARLIGKLLNVRIVCISRNFEQESLFLTISIDGKCYRNCGRCDPSCIPCLNGNNCQSTLLVATLKSLFPEVKLLQNKQIYSHCAIPIKNAEGRAIASICLLDDLKKDFTETDHDLLCILAQRVGLELERIETLKKIEQQERQLWHSQKMEALGQLTGGLAHDYNNLLSVIMGYTILLRDALTTDEKLKTYALQIQHASERGAQLTRKLLSFSQQKTTHAEVIELNKLLNEFHAMLEKLLTKRIRLIYQLQDDLWPVYLDSGDLEDVVINLCINAMHAIEGQGRIILRTRNLRVEGLPSVENDLPPGDYVVLEIEDTGVGIDEAIKDKIFEPFFTTKGKQGTGLGLSQVYGFVERNQGVIKVHSKLGDGACFSLYFPRAEWRETTNETDHGKKDENLSGNESILVVDDEQDLLFLSKNALEKQGYTVFTANNAHQALDILAEQAIDLLVSDIIMPEMDGYQLADSVSKRYPTIKIQLVSGFVDKITDVSSVDESIRQQLLYKPYSQTTLLKRIRVLLDDE